MVEDVAGEVEDAGGEVDWEDLGRERRAKWQTWAVILGFSLLIGGFFAVMDHEAGPIVLGILLGLCLLLACVVWLVAAAERLGLV